MTSLRTQSDWQLLQSSAKELAQALKAGEAAALQRYSGVFATTPPSRIALGQAQLIVARENGFETWDSLKTHTDQQNPIPTLEEFFIDALWVGHPVRASATLAAFPQLAKTDFYAACVTGKLDAVVKFLEENPALARVSGGPRGWEPLLYVCFSNFLSAPLKVRKLVAIAKLLLDHGADPNAGWINPQDNVRESALYGASGIANNAELTRLLLKAGAKTNDDEVLYHTSEFDSSQCLEMVLDAGCDPERVSFCLKRKLDFEDPAGVALFLEYGADPNVRHDIGGTKVNALHHAILRGRSAVTIGLLLDHGVEVEAKTGDGLTPYVLARRLGRNDLAQVLLKHGADGTISEVDRLMCACSSGDTSTINRLLGAKPQLLEQLTAQDLELLGTAAKTDNLKAAEVMLELGFAERQNPAPPLGMTPLHWAGWYGHYRMVELLLKYGPSLEALNQYGGTPLRTTLHAALHNAEECPVNRMDPAARTRHFVRTVQALVEAGSPVQPAMVGSSLPEFDPILSRSLEGTHL